MGIYYVSGEKWGKVGNYDLIVFFGWDIRRKNAPSTVVPIFGSPRSRRHPFTTVVAGMLKSSGLTGRYDNKVDSKGRLNIPATFRKELAPGEYDEVVVVFVPTGHLLLFNREYWSATIQQDIIDRQNTIDRKDTAGRENVWRTAHFLSEHSHMSTVDSQGRITIPQHLLRMAGINSEAAVIGISDRASVWAPDRYEAWKSKADVDETIADIGLY